MGKSVQDISQSEIFNTELNATNNIPNSPQQLNIPTPDGTDYTFNYTKLLVITFIILYYSIEERNEE